MRPLYVPLFVILFAGLLGPFASEACAQNAAGRSGQSSPTLDLDFRQGTGTDYVAAIRKIRTDVNIVETGDLRDIRVNDVSLRNVTVGAALEVIDGNHTMSDGRTINVDIDVHRDSPATQPIFLIRSRVAGRQPTTSMSRVWSLAQPLEGSSTADQILTAVEAALALFGTTYPDADLRYHEETKLLIARGHPEQVDTINSVLSELAKPTTRAGNDRAGQASDEEREHLHRELVEWRTRAELYHDELAQMRERLAKMEAEAHSRAMELQEAMRELHRLREVTTGRRENP